MLPAVHPVPTHAKIVRDTVAIWLCAGIWTAWFVTTVSALIGQGALTTAWRAIEAALYLLVVVSLAFSSLVYLIVRRGAYARFRAHRRATRAELDRHFIGGREPITVLVPSYAEEPAVIRKTLWSAALQEYPRMRIVLLIDDAPPPNATAWRQRLDATRAVGPEIEAALRPLSHRFSAALAAAESAMTPDDPSLAGVDGMRTLAREYRAAVRWLRTMAAAEERDDHIDDFFVDEVLHGLADDLETTANALEAGAATGPILPDTRIVELHRRLVLIFQVEITSFERKRYGSLSHEANKAMNLNAYIGLMGGAYAEQRVGDTIVLRPAGAADADLVVPYADYVLTLDADSVLLREYCLRLVYFLEQPENARVAVVQTPYSAFRGAPSRIERLAGATTDVQHVLHQGMTEYGATFWVGANAVIRMEALEDILEVEASEGQEVRRYVQDRTVIEDTESSLDLGVKGWTLSNYPERLSYSATPPDFGSLVIQRRRWSNGGLLILPKLWRQVFARRRAHQPMPMLEAMVRVNYLVSTAWASFGLLFLLLYPDNNRLVGPLVLLGALPYFVATAADLRYAGYRYSDVFRIYGFNLILLPVNLAGVLKSIQQAMTGKKIPFARTPKVKDRTATPLLFVLVPFAIVALSVYVAWRSFGSESWWTFGFAVFNAAAASWAIIACLGLWNALVDIWVGATDWMWVEVRRPRPAQERNVLARPEWLALLDDGTAAPGSEVTGVRHLSRLPQAGAEHAATPPAQSAGGAAQDPVMQGTVAQGTVTQGAAAQARGAQGTVAQDPVAQSPVTGSEQAPRSLEARR